MALLVKYTAKLSDQEKKEISEWIKNKKSRSVVKHLGVKSKVKRNLKKTK
jgi:hypothetical protein